MSERDYLRRTRPTSLDPADDPTFGAGSEQLSGPLPAPVPQVSRFRLRMFSEGAAGLASRTGIVIKYVVYLLILASCSMLTTVLLSDAGTTAYGGALMWFCCALLAITGAIGTLLQPANRNEMIATWRHYTFGLCITPSTAIAVIIWSLRGVLTSPEAANDTLASLLGFALPAVFITTLIIPPIMLVKYIAGYHTMNRSTMTDSELLNMATRNDRLQY